jgi:hypothetical protein
MPLNADEIKCLELAEQHLAGFDLRYEGGATADLCVSLCDRDYLEEYVNEKYAYLIGYELTALGAAALAAYRQNQGGN